MQDKDLKCEFCKKKLNEKNWYKIQGTNKYFCSLKHLEDYDNKISKEKNENEDDKQN